MRSLEEYDLNIEAFDAKTCVFAKVFDATEEEMNIIHLTPDCLGNWPVLNVMLTTTKAYILYTPQMTFLDGYDKFTSELLHQLIPESIIIGTRPSLIRP